MITLKELADEVARLRRSDGTGFQSACATILEGHGITERWDYYFSGIGQILGQRGGKSRHKNRKPGTYNSNRAKKGIPKVDPEFDGLTEAEIRQRLADSDL